MNVLVSIGILVMLVTGSVSPHPGVWQTQTKFSRNPGLFSDVQSKIKALEAAHAAGILTEAEYTTKKAELEAQLRPIAPPMDEATKQKLKALEAAHQAGILSDEEYNRKKAELLGQQPGAALILYKDPQGRFQFQHPAGWKIQALEGGQQAIALTRGKAALNIMPLPDGVSSVEQVVETITQQIREQWQKYNEVRRGQQKVGAQAAPVVEFTGVNPEGIQTHSQVVALASGAGGYLFIFSAPEVDPENSFVAVQPVWKTLLSSFTVMGKTGKTYRHQSGFSFQYPDDWTITEQEGVVQLVPPSASSTAAGPTELYFLIVEDASQNGIQRPDDPMVLQYLDQQIQTLSPALQRTGTPVPINMQAGQGAVVNWGASGAGGEVRARAFIGIIGNNGVILMGMGLKERLEARDQTLRQMFATLGVGTPQPSPVAAAPQVQASTGTAASPTISAEEVGDPNWGFKFAPPAGWKSQKNPGGVMLGHDTIAGAIFVIPHIEESFQAVQAEMQSGITDEGVQLVPAGAVQMLGENAVAGEYAGTFNDQQVKARGIGTFSPYGGGAYIVAVTTPEQYGPQLSGAADAIARGMQYFKVDVSELTGHFAGRWASVTSNTLTNMTLAPNGDYYDSYESSYSGNLTDGTFKTGDWAATGQDQNKGRWTVRGTKEQGMLIITLANGTQSTYQYQVHIEKGKTYWNEYFIDGSLYSKINE